MTSCNQHKVSVVTQGKKEINRSTLQIMTNVSIFFQQPKAPRLEMCWQLSSYFLQTHTHIHRHTKKKKKMLQAGGDKTEQKRVKK